VQFELALRPVFKDGEKTIVLAYVVGRSGIIEGKRFKHKTYLKKEEQTASSSSNN